MKIVLNKYIVADPEICHGKPTFKGTRIMVWQILKMLAAGESVEEILQDFPSLKRAHISVALEYAAQMIGGERYSFPRHLARHHAPAGR